jgi:sarcosine oxidase subunit beta
MKQKPDAIIIGAGLIGCAIAYELSKRGYKTLNIDKLPAAGFGSTSNSCAIVRFHYSTLDGAQMAYENYFYWKDWPNYIGPVDERGYAKFVECGFVIFRNNDPSEQNFINLFRQIGIKYEEWDLETLRQKFPIGDLHTFSPPRPIDDETFWADPTTPLTGGIYNPQGGYVNDPQLATYNLMQAAQNHGGEFLFNAEVVEVRKGNAGPEQGRNGRVSGITLSDGSQIDAPVVVNAAGPHSFLINRLAGVEEGMKIKTRALRREVHHVASPKKFNFNEQGFVFSDADCGIYFRPETGNNILVGSADPACDPKEWVLNPDQYQTELTDQLWKTQVYRLARRIPELEIPSKPSGIVSMYDVTNDWIPIYDQSDLPGFYLAIGTSGNQFKNAAGVGHLMASLIDAVEQGQNHDEDPVQVQMPYTGVVLNAGFYSRLRTHNTQSSHTVMG